MFYNQNERKVFLRLFCATTKLLITTTTKTECKKTAGAPKFP